MCLCAKENTPFSVWIACTFVQTYLFISVLLSYLSLWDSISVPKASVHPNPAAGEVPVYPHHVETLAEPLPGPGSGCWGCKAGWTWSHKD